jgi:hypothetical protein
MKIKDLERRRELPGADVAYLDKRIAELYLDKRITELQEAEAENPQPSIETLMEWEYNGYMLATDGCRVEPDGTCPHGKPSWLIRLGLI